MIRSELLQELHKDNPDLRADEIEQVVDIFFCLLYTSPSPRDRG